MIMVDITVPAMNKEYEFRLEESAYVSDIISEVGQILAYKVAGEERQEVSDMLLCDMESKRILPMGKTLKSCNIGNGSKLLLI